MRTPKNILCLGLLFLIGLLASSPITTVYAQDFSTLVDGLNQKSFSKKIKAVGA